MFGSDPPADPFPVSPASPQVVSQPVGLCQAVVPLLLAQQKGSYIFHWIPGAWRRGPVCTSATNPGPWKMEQYSMGGGWSQGSVLWHVCSGLLGPSALKYHCPSLCAILSARPCCHLQPEIPFSLLAGELTAIPVLLFGPSTSVAWQSGPVSYWNAAKDKARVSEGDNPARKEGLAASRGPSADRE